MKNHFYLIRFNNYCIFKAFFCNFVRKKKMNQNRYKILICTPAIYSAGGVERKADIMSDWRLMLFVLMTESFMLDICKQHKSQCKNYLFPMPTVFNIPPCHIISCSNKNVYFIYNTLQMSVFFHEVFRSFSRAHLRKEVCVTPGRRPALQADISPFASYPEPFHISPRVPCAA